MRHLKQKKEGHDSLLDENLQSNQDINMKIIKIIHDYKILFCRDPQPEEVALEVDITPEKAENLLSKLTQNGRWRRPTEIDKKKAQKKARLRLELASWIKLGCKNLPYLKSWSDEEFKEAETICNQYVNCLPKIKQYNKNDHEILAHIVFFWPELSWPIIGEPRTGAKFFENKNSDQTSIIENRSIPKNDLNHCIGKIPFLEETE